MPRILSVALIIHLWEVKIEGQKLYQPNKWKLNSYISDISNKLHRKNIKQTNLHLTKTIVLGSFDE